MSFVQLIFAVSYFFLQVLIPNGTYKGQKLMKLVKTNIPAKTKNTIPIIPGSTFVKNKTTIIAAIIARIILSPPPIFFFMIFYLNIHDETTYMNALALQQLLHIQVY
jgi:hypothetical protein